MDQQNDVCFSIMHYNGTEWKTLGFEMYSTEDRTTLITDIIDKLLPLGLHAEQGLSRQVVLDSMELNNSLDFSFESMHLRKQLEEQKVQNEKLREHLDQRNGEIENLQAQRVVMAK